MATPFRRVFLPAFLLAFLPIALPAHAEVRLREVPVVLDTNPDGSQLIGRCEIYYDDAATGKRPGILVFHEWWGRNQFTRDKARDLAKLGYAALACDLYGEARTTTDPAQAERNYRVLKLNRERLRSRAKAVLTEFTRQPEVDPDRLGAMGFCLGGTVSLELARSGANLKAVVSFHGDLAALPPSTPEAAAEPASPIKAHILVCHGAIDPLVPPWVVQGFLDEMNRAGVDYEFIAYGKSVHAFTNPSNGTDTSKPAAYNAEADRRSWVSMKDFFAEHLKPESH